MIQASNQLKPKQLAEQLAKQLSTEICFEKFRETLFKSVNAHTKVADMLSPEICIPLINLFPLVNLIDLIFYLNRDLITISIKQLLSHLIWGFRRYVLPYLTRNELEKLRQLVQLEFDLSKWSTGYYETQSPTFHLAACLGLHNELQQLVESWSDDQYDGEYQFGSYYHRPQEIAFGLGSPRLVESHIRRLKLRLQPPAYIQQTSAYIRAWLACTKYAALDYIRDTILTASNKEDAAALTEGFAVVNAPEAAPFMLELMLSSKAPQVARKWLEENPMLAIAGLVSLIGQHRLGKAPVGRLTEAAINWLRSLKRQGSGQLIQTCLDREPDEIAEQVRRAVLDFDEKEYIAFDSRTTPEWLKQVIAQVKRSQTPSWLALSDLPPVVVGEYCLNDQQVEALLTALKQSSLDNPHALVTNLKQHSEPTSLDRFAWQLFERWLGEGAPSKEKWAFVALGLLGSDASALKLAPMICTMPGEGQHKRAVFGLECLRVMGTDTALTQINGIAQKVKFRPLRAKAQECLEAIAKERNLTREQLEDRIVPDCGLDRNGMRFNYGNRQFQFAMGPELRPMVRDCNGKFKADLPKPGTNDNIDLANQAIEDWKLLKKQIREVVKIQVARLEQAMIGGRRWQIDEFETLIVKHPLMTHLAQLLLWGGYDTSGKLVTTFRITEDQNYATVTDESAELEEVTTVGIIHPFHLSLELQSAWGQLLSDYEIIPPFLQLGRPIYYLEPDEINQKELTRFSNLKIPAASLVGTFEQRKWLRHVEGVDSGSIIAEHYKHFYGVNLTAIVEHSTGVWIGAIADSEDQIMECCYFVSGIVTPTSYPNSPTKIPLNQVDPVVVSEVLNDLMAIALKAR